MAEPSGRSPRAALFLDRDGVINEEVHYLGEAERTVLVAGAGAAIAAANRAGVPVVVVTNQAGIARGAYGEEGLAAVTRRLDELLAAAGAHVDATYHCPHHPDATIERYRVRCECRKPRPGLLRRAAAELGLALERSALVGDKASDLGAARAAGCAAVLVRTGHGLAAERELAGQPGAYDVVFDSLADAMPWVLARLGGAG